MTDHPPDDVEVARFHRVLGETLGRPHLVFHVPEAPLGDIVSDLPHIDIFIYRPNDWYWMLVTAGMSTQAQSSPEHTRVELYMKLPPATTEDDVHHACRMLWRIARFPFNERDKFVRPWHLLHTSLPPVAAASPINAVVLTPAIRDDNPIHRLAHALPAELLYAYGLHDSERLQAETWGFADREHFVRAMFRAAGSLTDPARAPVAPTSLVS